MLKRLISSLVTWPSLKGWVSCVPLFIMMTAGITLLALSGRFLHWQPDPSRLWRLPMILIIPAFSEELVFRGFIPKQGESQHPWLWIAATTIAFTAWHAVEAVTILPGARLFLKPAFLACAATLGLACAILRCRTGSLWPAVAFHAVVVWLWQSFLGGLGVAELLKP